MSSGAVADSGLISRVSFTCDYGAFSYSQFVGFDLRTLYGTDDDIDTISSAFKTANGSLVNVTQQYLINGSAITDTRTAGFPSGVTHNFHMTFFFVGHVATAYTDESELKENYFNSVKLINHTQSAIDVVQSDAFSIGTYGPVVRSSGGTTNVSGADSTISFDALRSTSTDSLNWAEDDLVTVELRGY
jgi:hypothetical protein